MTSQLRLLPAVDTVAQALDPQLPAALRNHCSRLALAELRQRHLQAGLIWEGAEQALSLACEGARDRLAALQAPALPPVINATGTVLHTGLGRAPLSPRAQAAVSRVAAGYCWLEMDRSSGERGNRQSHVEAMLCTLSGAEAALVVNNCAGATVLILQALAQGREVPVSRGELVEIGGSFRIPEIMACAGCRLVEVGSTNRTHRRDYERAMGPDTALLLRVNQSNFVQAGFTAQVSTQELATLAQAHQLPLVVDQGSGGILNMRDWGYAAEPIQADLAAGAQLVCGSGDKLLGGPQAGIILGGREWVARCAAHPLARALRVDKLTLAALAATLQDYLFSDPALAVPSLLMLSADAAAARQRAEAIQQALGCGSVEASRGAVGSGALPTDGPESWSWVLAGSAQRRQRQLRLGEPSVVGRIREDRLLIDCATVFDQQLPDLIAALRKVL
ncbi:MAG: L-seryl-tRNA(Sec) selenium transferase [Planctomycetota bacterium]|nr:MAG: L-seryl-tRNA(Sec) selenium transferase [Planctomycetota bacterium]